MKLRAFTLTRAPYRRSDESDRPDPSDGLPGTVPSALRAVMALLLGACAGCNSDPKSADVPEAKVAGETVSMATNSPQLAALTVETVGAEQPCFVPLTGRLVWDDDVTVRVFTPFAGIVRKLLADVGQPLAKDAPLAEIQSADFGQAQADARKAESDFRLADRNLTRLRDLFEHGASPKKDVDAAEADFDRARAERPGPWTGWPFTAPG